jgi:hypothetical protein
MKINVKNAIITSYYDKNVFKTSAIKVKMKKIALNQVVLVLTLL